MASFLENTSRIANASEDIKTSLLNKGAEFSEGEKIDTYSSKIDSLNVIQPGNYNVECYIRIDDVLVGEGIEFNVVGTDGTTQTATSRSAGFIYLTLSYGVGYDIQPLDTEKYYANSHELIYHRKEDGNYFTTDYYFYTAGSGETIPEINDCSYLLYYSGYNMNSKTMNHFDSIQNLIINSVNNISKATSMCKNSYIKKDLFERIINKDFSNCTDISGCFDSIYIYDTKLGNNYSCGSFSFKLNLSSCTNMGSAFSSFCSTNSNYYTEFVVDFDGTTTNVTNFSYLFKHYTVNTRSRNKKVVNINMDKCTSCSDMFYYGKTENYDDILKQFTFKGSFGGLSTTASLTLKFPGASGDSRTYNYAAFIETINSVSENTNGNVRIFSVPTLIYNQLTDDDIEIATSKGYEISSY